MGRWWEREGCKKKTPLPCGSVCVRVFVCGRGVWFESVVVLITEVVLAFELKFAVLLVCISVIGGYTRVCPGAVDCFFYGFSWASATTLLGLVLRRNLCRLGIC